jgi:hypothetical protein
LETVDGGLLEDVTISNITMRDISNSPFFLRLGSRMRGPQSAAVGALRRVTISDVIVYNAEARYASLISGVPGHDIEDVRLDNIRIYYKGGGTKEQAALQPPEKETDYPEPTMFGEMPTYGFFIRHVRGLQMSDISLKYVSEDVRPPFIISDAKAIDLNHVKMDRASSVPSIILNDVEDFSVRQSPPLNDTVLPKVKRQQL